MSDASDTYQGTTPPTKTIELFGLFLVATTLLEAWRGPGHFRVSCGGESQNLTLEQMRDLLDEATEKLRGPSLEVCRVEDGQLLN